MDYEQAKKSVSEGKSVSLVTRDATRSWFVRHSCRLDSDGDLVHTHPTDARGHVSAPRDGRYELD